MDPLLAAELILTLCYWGSVSLPFVCTSFIMLAFNQNAFWNSLEPSLTLNNFFQVISGHTGWVRCLAVEPGNQWFCTGSNDRIIKVR